MPGVCLTPMPGDVAVVNEIKVPHLGSIPIRKGDFKQLPKHVQHFVAEKALLMKPRALYIVDGSEQEGEELIGTCVERGVAVPLKHYEKNYLVRTDPRDVARVESKTFICTKDKYDTVCHVAEGVHPLMGNWISPDEYDKVLDERFPGCMNGRTMYVIPFSMGPIGSPLAKIGVELTDSIYVVLCMRLMTRVSPKVMQILKDGEEFVRCIHTVGVPRPVKQKVINNWPCNPEKTIISHRPVEREIWSFGSGYGGNSLLGKKCFALRIAGNIARDEGWLAEHMLIMGITPPSGKEKFIAAAFPSACGKTNLAMLQSPLPGYKVQCIGDDIAWMRFNKEDGTLRAINPEAGFFGVCPGTSMKTNPMAMMTCMKNTIMTNTAETEHGEFFWEGMEDELIDKNCKIITWLNEDWKIGMPGKAAHPNSRFTTPSKQCPVIHPRWEDSDGVPISCLVFGGRRPEGVPLVFESLSWNHGIFIASCLKSEATAAAEHAGKKVMHDPFAMRPFMGYNFGKYLRHWMSMDQAGRKMPRIYHVNWFRLTPDGKFIWPGFGDNIRALEWMLNRMDLPREDRTIGVDSPIGVLPKEGSINLDGITVDWKALMDVPKQYWQDDAKEVRKFMEEQVGPDLPAEIRAEMDAQEQRIMAM